MERESMPPELLELENRLRARAGDEPGAGLRGRVMQTVAAELATRARPSAAETWNGWWWAAIAAGVLIAMNLSMVVASQNEFTLRPAPSPNQMTAELQALWLLESQQEGQFK
jgi:hypothetical protein